MTCTRLVVVSAADEQFVMPLTVMVRSLLENLARSTQIDLYILEDNVSAKSRRCAEDSWSGFGMNVHWIAPDKRKIEDNLTGKVFAAPPAVYFRLLLGDILPREATKAIYLDADIMVLGDLTELSEVALKGNIILAVPDACASAFHLERMARIAFKEGVRFDTQSLYFNSGVMLIDLDEWRKEKIGERALQFLWDYKDVLSFRDQDALNCALQGRWGALPLTWNYHELPDCLFLWDSDFYNPDDIEKAISDPKIIHFTSRAKPWMKRCCHIKTSEFCQCFSRTRWVMNARQSQSTFVRLLRKYLIMPHSRLNQLVWRERYTKCRGELVHSVLRLLALNPWMLITYPFWQIFVWLYYFLFVPVSRRRMILGRR